MKKGNSNRSGSAHGAEPRRLRQGRVRKQNFVMATSADYPPYEFIVLNDKNERSTSASTSPFPRRSPRIWARSSRS